MIKSSRVFRTYSKRRPVEYDYSAARLTTPESSAAESSCHLPTPSSVASEHSNNNTSVGLDQCSSSSIKKTAKKGKKSKLFKSPKLILSKLKLHTSTSNNFPLTQSCKAKKKRDIATCKENSIGRDSPLKGSHPLSSSTKSPLRNEASSLYSESMSMDLTCCGKQNTFNHETVPVTHTSDSRNKKVTPTSEKFPSSSSKSISISSRSTRRLINIESSNSNATIVNSLVKQAIRLSFTNSSSKETSDKWSNQDDSISSRDNAHTTHGSRSDDAEINLGIRTTDSANDDCFCGTLDSEMVDEVMRGTYDHTADRASCTDLVPGEPLPIEPHLLPVKSLPGQLPNNHWMLSENDLSPKQYTNAEVSAEDGKKSNEIKDLISLAEDADAESLITVKIHSEKEKTTKSNPSIEVSDFTNSEESHTDDNTDISTHGEANTSYCENDNILYGSFYKSGSAHKPQISTPVLGHSVSKSNLENISISPILTSTCNGELTRHSSFMNSRLQKANNVNSAIYQRGNKGIMKKGGNRSEIHKSSRNRGTMPSLISRTGSFSLIAKKAISRNASQKQSEPKKARKRSNPLKYDPYYFICDSDDDVEVVAPFLQKHGSKCSRPIKAINQRSIQSPPDHSEQIVAEEITANQNVDNIVNEICSIIQHGNDILTVSSQQQQKLRSIFEKLVSSYVEGDILCRI